MADIDNQIKEKEARIAREEEVVQKEDQNILDRWKKQEALEKTIIERLKEEYKQLMDGDKKMGIEQDTLQKSQVVSEEPMEDAHKEMQEEDTPVSSLPRDTDEQEPEKGWNEVMKPSSD